MLLKIMAYEEQDEGLPDKWEIEHILPQKWQSNYFLNISDDIIKEESVVRKFRTTASDGKNYNVIYYNLDMIISLGYRIKSSIATKFRRWATERIKEYMIKGFTMDDEKIFYV